MKKLNIAIIGLGNIGSYLFRYLKKNKNILSKKNNCIPNVVYISAKNKSINKKILTEKNNCLPIIKYVSAKNKKRKKFPDITTRE